MKFSVIRLNLVPTSCRFIYDSDHYYKDAEFYLNIRMSVRVIFDFMRKLYRGPLILTKTSRYKISKKEISLVATV
jgi:hypothetical protein